MANTGGGAITPDNLVAGVNATNPYIITVEGHLRTFGVNVVTWGVAQNYNPRFLEDVAFWSTNLASSVREEAAQLQEEPQARFKSLWVVLDRCDYKLQSHADPTEFS